MTITTPAKINLSLDVTGKRADGYHSVEMLMQTVSLCDTVTLEKSDAVTVRTNLSYVPGDERNIAHRAASAFFARTGIRGGADIAIEKHIPVGAGLGGGSANAAGVLKALNAMYGAGLTMPELEQIGVTLGADVPFFFRGGTCLATGLGEVLNPIDPPVKGFAVIVKPEFSVSTKWVYQSLDWTRIRRHPDTSLLVSAIRQGNMRLWARRMANVLEVVTAKRYPQILHIKRRLLDHGALGSLMSGSGSAVFGVFDNENAAQRCAAALSDEHSVFITSFR